MKTILLHSCCAVCASSCVERLIEDGWNVSLFYDNPNIFPDEERKKRLDFVEFLSDYYKVRLFRGGTSHSKWLEHIKGYENCSERGERCLRCFEFNLNLANEERKRLGLDSFCTSLTVSRYKNSKDIIGIGKTFEGFIEYDFKKKGGEERSIALAKELEIYRQKYCGCEYSQVSKNYSSS